MPKRIAVVEDEPDARANYVDAIRKRGYDVDAFADRKSALAAFDRTLPDLAILDIRLGDEDLDGGFVLCRDLLAKSPDLPIIFLTARDGDVDKISGLRLGAWEYLSKPISLDYLVERIASLLRINEIRSSPDERGRGQIVEVGELRLDKDALLVSWRGKRIDLSGTEFRMLAKLVRQPGHAVTYESLMQTTSQTFVTSNTINTHIRNIRKKFESVDSDFNAIRSEYAFGYRWNA